MAIISLFEDDESLHVTGPEIMSKMAGESESNLRKG
jgi:SpoVK/Ycf46/Vps4 family AAA+-type ATPase